MGFSITLMPSFPRDAILLNDDCSDQRIWLDVATALLGRIEGAFHPDFISTVHESTLHKEKPRNTRSTRKRTNLFIMVLSCFRVFREFRSLFLLLPTATGPFNTEGVVFPGEF